MIVVAPIGTDIFERHHAVVIVIWRPGPVAGAIAEQADGGRIWDTSDRAYNST